MSRTRNLFETIAASGSDQDYVPRITRDFQPTDAPAGSWEKIEVLRRRVECGFPLWHKLDRSDYSPAAEDDEESWPERSSL